MGTNDVDPVDEDPPGVRGGDYGLPGRAQGHTVDTAHAIVSATTTREVLLAAATRGRDRNKLYVAVACDPDAATGHRGSLEQQSARDVPRGILAREGADASAHDLRRCRSPDSPAERQSGQAPRIS